MLFLGIPIEWYVMAYRRLKAAVEFLLLNFPAVLLAIEAFLYFSDGSHLFVFTQAKGWTVLVTLEVTVFLLAGFCVWLVAVRLCRLRFQFSLRSLLFLVFVAALPCSWLAVEKAEADKQKKVVDAIRSNGGKVTYDYQTRDGSPNRSWGYGVIPRNQRFLRELLGDDFFDDAPLVEFRNKFDLGCLEDYRSLKELCVYPATDDDLRIVGRLNHLNTLRLSGTTVTDAGLTHLKALTALVELDVRYTNVTDAGLVHLDGLTRLRSILLVGTMVTKSGLIKLFQAHPDCVLSWKGEWLNGPGDLANVHESGM